MADTKEFDHHSAECAEDQVSYYESFRNECPVGRSGLHGEFVYITKYDDVFRVARNDELFSSSRASSGRDGTAIVIPSGPGLENFQFPLELDPPDSVEYRKLLEPLLTPEAVDEMRPMIKRHTTRIIDEFIESGSTDFVRDLTNPLPSAVTLDWIGFPEDDWARIGVPIHDIFVAQPGSERQRRGGEGLAYMEKRINELIADRRDNPKDDAMSYLVAQEKSDGTPFTDAELLSTIGLLISGGVDTTTSLTGAVLVHLSQHPEVRERLKVAPDLLVDATDEFLRAFPSTTSMARTATADTALGGCPVKAGERILLPWVAANYDPEVFPAPREVQLDRDASRHLSFGTGSHRCPGSHLARAMFHEMVTQVLARIPDYMVDEEGLVGYPSRGTASGWDVIPATFTPGERSENSDLDIFTARPDWLDLKIENVETVAEDVIQITLSDPHGNILPEWKPGAHLELRLPSGLVRQYSLCGSPSDRYKYTVAVLREQDGRGGSAEMHNVSAAGLVISVRPRNHFPMVEAENYVLLAGGIGITPILTMVKAASELQKPFTLYYGGRSRSSMGFLDQLEEIDPGQINIMPEDEIGGVLDLRSALAAVDGRTAVFCCGPAAMIDAAEDLCAELGVEDQLNIERFNVDGIEDPFDPSMNTPFEAYLARSDKTIHVPEDKRLMEVARECGVSGLTYDCEKGFCGSCETRVISGKPEHWDSVLNEEERDSEQIMMICVGRAKDERIVLDM